MQSLILKCFLSSIVEESGGLRAIENGIEKEYININYTINKIGNKYRVNIYNNDNKIEYDIKKNTICEFNLGDSIVFESSNGQVILERV